LWKKSAGPFSAWFPAAATPDQVAEAIANRLSASPSADEIADAVIRKGQRPPTADEIAVVLLNKIAKQTPEAQIVDYGIDGPQQFHALATLRNWQQYKDYRCILITRTSIADRNRMTDDWIAKSIPYTIDGPCLG
jgi:hypothetical protein